MCVCVSVFLCLCLMAVRNCQLCQGSLSWWCRRCRRCRHPDTWRVVRGMASRSKVDTWGPKKGSTNRTWLSSTPAFLGDFNGFQWISTYPFFRGKLKLKNTWSFCASFCASQFICHRFSMRFRQFWRAAEVGTLKLGFKSVPTGRSVITNWVNIIDLVQHMYTYLYVVGERNWNQASKISIQTSHPSTFTRVFSWFVLPSVHLVSWESVTGTDTIRYF